MRCLPLIVYNSSVTVALMTIPASRIARRQDWIPEDGPHAAVRYFVATASLGQYTESTPSRRRRLARLLSERSAELQRARQEQGSEKLSLSLDMTQDEATQDDRFVLVLRLTVVYARPQLADSNA